MVISESEAFHKTYNGDVHINNGACFTLHGIITGNIRLTDNAILKLHGIVNGEIFVDISCTANINGILNGNIVNNGSATIYGIVNSNSILPQNVIIERGSIVNGVKY